MGSGLDILDILLILLVIKNLQKPLDNSIYLEYLIFKLIDKPGVFMSTVQFIKNHLPLSLNTNPELKKDINHEINPRNYIKFNSWQKCAERYAICNHSSVLDYVIYKIRELALSIFDSSDWQKARKDLIKQFKANSFTINDNEILIDFKQIKKDSGWAFLADGFIQSIVDLYNDNDRNLKKIKKIEAKYDTSAENLAYTNENLERIKKQESLKNKVSMLKYSTTSSGIKRELDSTIMRLGKDHWIKYQQDDKDAKFVFPRQAKDID